MTADTLAAEIVAFWADAGPDAWFAKDDGFDARCRQYEAAHMAAAARLHDGWMDTAEGALALVLLLDQFPRNLYRDTAHAFATDPLALHFADAAIARGHDTAVAGDLALFFYLPFEHAEDAVAQAQSIALTARLRDRTDRADEYIRFAQLHAEVIDRFGRFPHRNPALGRETTAEEQAYLDEGGFAG